MKRTPPLPHLLTDLLALLLVALLAFALNGCTVAQRKAKQWGESPKFAEGTDMIGQILEELSTAIREERDSAERAAPLHDGTIRSTTMETSKGFRLFEIVDHKDNWHRLIGCARETRNCDGLFAGQEIDIEDYVSIPDPVSVARADGTTFDVQGWYRLIKVHDNTPKR